MWTDDLKAKVEAEVCYSPAHKAFLESLVDEAAAENPTSPEAALAALINKINNAGMDRSRELAKFCGRVSWEYGQNKAGLDEAASAILLSNIIKQKR